MTPEEFRTGKKAPIKIEGKGPLTAGQRIEIILEKEGVKHDTGKTRMDLLAPDFLFGLSNILTYGADKYADRNWELGMDWGRVYGALQRHLNAWWAGEELDEESGLHHLDHAACCIMFLSSYQKRKIGKDTREIIASDHRTVLVEDQNVSEIVSDTKPTQPSVDGSAGFNGA